MAAWNLDGMGRHGIGAAWGGMGWHGIRAAWGGMELGWHGSDMPLGQHAIGKTWGGIALGWHGAALWNWDGMGRHGVALQ